MSLHHFISISREILIRMYEETMYEERIQVWCNVFARPSVQVKSEDEFPALEDERNRQASYNHPFRDEIHSKDAEVRQTP